MPVVPIAVMAFDEPQSLRSRGVSKGDVPPRVVRGRRRRVPWGWNTHHEVGQSGSGRQGRPPNANRRAYRALTVTKPSIDADRAAGHFIKELLRGLQVGGSETFFELGADQS